MGASLFQFQQFQIRQDRCAMKVSTDGILLGAWAPLANGPVLDIGTGTGLLALMTAQRNPDVKIDALEIEAEAAAQAQENFASSPWAKRLSGYHTSLQYFAADTDYDLILCNPPYFREGIAPAENARAHARHGQSLDFDSLATLSANLVTDTGRLAMIMPYDRLHDMEVALAKGQWFTERRTLVRAVPHKRPYRILLLAGRQNVPLREDELTIANREGRYTSAFKALTAGFYL